MHKYAHDCMLFSAPCSWTLLLCSQFLADEVLECSRAFRDHYCASVTLAASNSDMFRLAKVSNSNILGKIIYSLLLCPDSNGQMFSFERRQHVLFLAAASISYVAAFSWLNKIMGPRKDNTESENGKDRHEEDATSSSPERSKS